MPITFDEFVDEASIVLNIKLNGYKLKRVQRRTDSLMRRYHVKNYSECLQLLKNDLSFKNAYLNHFTINTSEFFRNPDNFTYLQEQIFPELFSKKDKVKIWSAPCSNGSEPYTIAIILSELGYKDHQYKIVASDLDKEILSAAKEAVYNANSIQKVPDNILKKYFTLLPKVHKKYKLDKSITSKVTFGQKDLINESYTSNWDIILSRNFFIYLTSEIKEMLTHKFTNALNPGGYLFLGNTEFIFNPEKYGLKKIYSSFYQKIIN
ncbi:MAG: CheR family methyltransferase [Halothermotrichaceae bacterium]